MSLARYSALVLALVGGSLALLWPVVLTRLDSRQRWAMLLGGGLAAANALAAYALAVWSRPRSTRTFLGAVLGGMLARMLILLGAFAAAILVLGLPSVPLTASLLGYFAILLAVELTLLHRMQRSVAAR